MVATLVARRIAFVITQGLELVITLDDGSTLLPPADVARCANAVPFLLAHLEARSPSPDYRRLLAELEAAVAERGNRLAPPAADVSPSVPMITTRQAATVLSILDRTVRHRCARDALPAL